MQDPIFDEIEERPARSPATRADREQVEKDLVLLLGAVTLLQETAEPAAGEVLAFHGIGSHAESLLGMMESE
ncbi:MAG: hypothetical protein WAM82_36875 [Thermoanaerobaculia bacterium]